MMNHEELLTRPFDATWETGVVVRDMDLQDPHQRALLAEVLAKRRILLGEAPAEVAKRLRNLGFVDDQVETALAAASGLSSDPAASPTESSALEGKSDRERRNLALEVARHQRTESKAFPEVAEATMRLAGFTTEEAREAVAQAYETEPASALKADWRDRALAASQVAKSDAAPPWLVYQGLLAKLPATKARQVLREVYWENLLPLPADERFAEQAQTAVGPNTEITTVDQSQPNGDSAPAASTSWKVFSTRLHPRLAKLLYWTAPLALVPGLLFFLVAWLGIMRGPGVFLAIVGLLGVIYLALGMAAHVKAVSGFVSKRGGTAPLLFWLVAGHILIVLSGATWDPMIDLVLPGYALAVGLFTEDLVE